MAHKAKAVPTKKRVVKRRKAKVLPLEAIYHPSEEVSADSRAAVLEALASVLITQNDTIQAIAMATTAAPGIANTFKRS